MEVDPDPIEVALTTGYWTHSRDLRSPQFRASLIRTLYKRKDMIFDDDGYPENPLPLHRVFAMRKVGYRKGKGVKLEGNYYLKTIIYIYCEFVY